MLGLLLSCSDLICSSVVRFSDVCILETFKSCWTLTNCIEHFDVNACMLGLAESHAVSELTLEGSIRQTLILFYAHLAQRLSTRTRLDQNIFRHYKACVVTHLEQTKPQTTKQRLVPDPTVLDTARLSYGRCSFTCRRQFGIRHAKEFRERYTGPPLM
jgi:hypothetical protein